MLARFPVRGLLTRASARESSLTSYGLALCFNLFNLLLLQASRKVSRSCFFHNCVVDIDQVP